MVVTDGAVQSDAVERLSRYRTVYGLDESVPLTFEQVAWHLELERRLTAQLLESTPANRWETFQSCYDELYRSLPWLVDTGGEGDVSSWSAVIGPPPRSLYEVGSGAGRLALALAEGGYSVEATDVSRKRGGDRPTHKTLRWTVTDGVYLDRFAGQPPYDAVISDQVIEHLHPDDIHDHFAGVRAILKPSGRYVFRTPHRFTGPHDVSKVFGFDVAVGMHLHEYTNRELVEVARSVGFTSVRAVFRLPHSIARGNRTRQSAVYLHYLSALESTLSGVSPPLRKRVVGRLPSPLRPRVFLAVS